MQYEQWKLHRIEKELEELDIQDDKEQNGKIHCFEPDDKAAESKRRDLLEQLSEHLKAYGETSKWDCNQQEYYRDSRSTR